MSSVMEIIDTCGTIKSLGVNCEWIGGDGEGRETLLGRHMHCCLNELPI